MLWLLKKMKVPSLPMGITIFQIFNISSTKGKMEKLQKYNINFNSRAKNIIQLNVTVKISHIE